MPAESMLSFQGEGHPGGQNTAIEGRAELAPNLEGTSKNSPYFPHTTKLRANDSASFSFRFIYVHSSAVRDRQ
jgi:hypothetical protein